MKSYEKEQKETTNYLFYDFFSKIAKAKQRNYFYSLEYVFSIPNLPSCFIIAKHSGKQHLTDQTEIIALPYTTVNVRLGYQFHYYGN